MNFNTLKRTFLLPFIVCAIFISTGCAPKQNQYPAYTNPTETKWIAENIDGTPVEGFAHIWMRLDSNGKIYGSGGCNSFRGNYSYNNGVFKTGPLAMTRKSCPKGLGLQEFRFMQALGMVDSMQKRDGMLFMEGQGNSLLFSKGH